MKDLSLCAQKHARGFVKSLPLLDRKITRTVELRKKKIDLRSLTNKERQLHKC